LASRGWRTWGCSVSREVSGISRALKLGLIGFGYWGPNLFRNLIETEGADVVSCADKRPDRRALAQRRYPALKVTDDASAVIDDPEIDAVVIATPVSTHYELARRALGQGKHVLVEKPMTRSVAEGEELIELAEKNGLVLMVDHTFIYTGAVRRMKELIDRGELGDLYYFDSVRVNLGIFQHDVDVVWDLAPHDLSILTHLIQAAPTHVSAIGADHVGIGHSDIAYITVFFASSFIAHFHVNWLSPVKVRQILIGGDRKMMVYDDMEQSEKVRVYDSGIKVTTADDIYATLVDYRTGDMWAPKLDFGEALGFECAHFVDCVRYKTIPLSNGQAGLTVVRVLEAASRSLAANGERIAL